MSPAGASEAHAALVRHAESYCNETGEGIVLTVVPDGTPNPEVVGTEMFAQIIARAGDTMAERVTDPLLRAAIRQHAEAAAASLRALAGLVRESATDEGG